MPVDLPEMTPADPLGRGVFDRSKAQRARGGKIIPRIFLEDAGVELISVDRLDHATDDEMAAIADQAAHLRHQAFHGWAVVTVEDASRSGRTVHESWVVGNPYHADIELNLPENGEKRDVQKQHATQLAASADWRERPT